MTFTLPNYEKAHVLVVGDVMLDRYWHGQTSRISPEAPVPIVHIQQMQELPGAAANVALNTAALGAQVILLSMTGADADADKLQLLLNDKHISTYFQRVAGTPTINKLRVLSQHQQLIRLDFEQNFYGVDNTPLISNYRKHLAQVQMVVLSDYAKGTLQQVPQLIAGAKAQQIPILIDPKGNDFNQYRGASLLTPNRKEFEIIVGECATEKQLIEKGWRLIDEFTLGGLLITRSEEGMLLLQPDHPPLIIPATKQEIYDVTGAGDTVIGVLAASMAAGLPVDQAAVMANKAAGIVVNCLGAATVSPAQLRRALQSDTHEISRGILTASQAMVAINDARAHQEKVVMTNGCFDVLHAGHVQYLNQARQLGDRLIVAINSDESVKRLKGAARPINSLANRMSVLAGLSAVDWVVAFDEDTPEQLIRALLPDTLVKGADYQIEDIVGAKVVLTNGGQVKTLPLVPNCSTTQMIEKIQSNYNVIV